MKQTLLQMTQDVLSSISGDEVNSIADTVEAMQVATIIKNVYFNVIARAGLPEHDQLFQLTASGDPASPTLMYRPDNVNKMEWIKYYDTNINDGVSQQSTQFGSYSHDLNLDLVPSGWTTASTSSVTVTLGQVTFTVTAGLAALPNNQARATSGTASMFGTVVSYIGTQLTLNVTNITGSGTLNAWSITQVDGNTAAPGYRYVTILPIQQFLDMVNHFNGTDQDVQSFTFQDDTNNKFQFYYKTDRTPEYCTVIKDYYVIFDSFDNTQDSTLQGSKTMCFGQLEPGFSMQDNFIPDMDDQQFPLLINESKSLAYFELKQATHSKAEQESRRQWVSLQKDKSLTNKPTYFHQLPNFGRHRGTGGYSVGPSRYPV